MASLQYDSNSRPSDHNSCPQPIHVMSHAAGFPSSSLFVCLLATIHSSILFLCHAMSHVNENLHVASAWIYSNRSRSTLNLTVPVNRDANIRWDQIGAGGPGGGSLLVGFRAKPWLGGQGGEPEADENLQSTSLNLHVKCILIIVNLSQTEHVNANLETYNEKIYCKRGYFRWGKISRKCWQDISRGGNFHETTPISFINAYGFYFRVGVIFAKKTKARKTRKLPHAKISTFTVQYTLTSNTKSVLI